MENPVKNEAQPWKPQARQAIDALDGQRGTTEPPPVRSASAPVYRKPISLADFQGKKREVDEAKDFLYVPKELIPDGISIEWKRKSVLNKEDKKHSQEVYRAGWQYIPSDSEGFAEHFASFISGDIFEYEGLVLMYRPLYMTEAAKAEEARKAGALVKDKFDEMGYNSGEKDMPGKRFKLERGFEEKLPGGNPAAVSVPE
jgi:hypothetical protein